MQKLSTRIWKNIMRACVPAHNGDAKKSKVTPFEKQMYHAYLNKICPTF